jgi:hypothetical protein
MVGFDHRQFFKLVVNAFTKMYNNLFPRVATRPPVHSSFYLHFNSFLFIYCCRTFYEIKLPSFSPFAVSLTLFSPVVSHRYTKFTARLQCPSVPLLLFFLYKHIHTQIPSITLHIKIFIVSLSFPLWITCELNFIYRFPFCAHSSLSLTHSPIHFSMSLIVENLFYSFVFNALHNCCSFVYAAYTHVQLRISFYFGCKSSLMRHYTKESESEGEREEGGPLFGGLL